MLLLVVATAVAAGAGFALLRGQATTAPPAAGSTTPAAAPAAAPARQSAPVASLVAPLADRLAQDPNDPTGWALLGQSYDYMGEPKLAADAYRQAQAYGNDDPAIAAALQAAENAFINQTLSGSVSTGAAMAPALSASAPGSASAGSGASGVAVRGTVRIADSLADRVAATDTVFVYARAAGGPPMPLAAMRASAASLPLTFVLDDSSAMSPNRTLSAAAKVTVIARVSRSGNATTQPGDLIGESAPLDPRAGTPLNLTIDRIVEPGS
jgi:cytochrome c-type biogenesis protein CcmH